MSAPGPVPREEFEHFLVALTHEIRNRLNGIALEAADIAELAGPPPARRAASGTGAGMLRLPEKNPRDVGARRLARRAPQTRCLRKELRELKI